MKWTRPNSSLQIKFKFGDGQSESTKGGVFSFRLAPFPFNPRLLPTILDQVVCDVTDEKIDDAGTEWPGCCLLPSCIVRTVSSPKTLRIASRSNLISSDILS